jgi:uncharacterized protein (TIGR00251 family)
VSDLRVIESNGKVRFSVRVQPRASRSEVVGIYGDALRIRLAAPPVDGAANAELVDFLAKIFAVARRSIKILAGESSRSKIVEVEGITERAVHDVAAGIGR